MIGIVVVSHSRALAEAAVGLARELVGNDGPQIAIAAGLDDGSFGTDAAAISLAIDEVDSPEGVLVLLDLGSAVLSTELAVEFLAEGIAERVRISPAPLVEGLLAAVVQASVGGSLAEADQEARSALAGKTEHLSGSGVVTPPLDLPRPAARSSQQNKIVIRTTVRNPHGIHVRPAAAIVTGLRGVDADVQLSNATTGRGPVPANSLSRISSLEVAQDHVFEARITGPQAELARDILAELAARDFGEDLRARPARFSNATSAVLPASRPMLKLPVAAERRAVIGEVVRTTTRPSTVGYKVMAPKDELARFTEAAAEVDDFLGELGQTGTEVQGIIEAQRLLLSDRELHHGVVGLITAGFSAVDAVEQHLTEMAREFDGFADAYLRERGQDLRSLRRLLLLALTGAPLADQGPDEARIWVMDELDAATAVRLDARTCLGVITVEGGSSGHGMLAAQARGIPVLTGRPDADAIPDGTCVAIDPVTRELWIDPDDGLRDELAARNQRRAESAQHAQARAHEPATTTDGRRISVQANVGSLEEAAAAAQEGAEGSGVVRTEVLFATAVQAPSTAVQAELFVRLGQAMGAPITIRSWDAAGDKPMAFLPNAREANPALGERGIRAMQRVPEVFRDQVRAVLLAARQVDVQLQLPMVTTPDEVRWARGIIDEVRAELDAPPIPVGIMVEVPAAALRAADFAGLIDFASIGTNDLSQYTQAADRGNAAVRDLARQDAPAVLDLVRMTCEALPDLAVTVCGDLASDPAATAQLIALGVQGLSVRPRMVAEIKEAVRAC